MKSLKNETASPLALADHLKIKCRVVCTHTTKYLQAMVRCRMKYVGCRMGVEG